MSARSRVLSGYRRLFRTRKFVFAGDAFAMQETRKAIKDEFIKNKYAPTEGDHFEGLLSVIDEVDKMLRFGVVRGELNPKTGNYGTATTFCVRLAVGKPSCLTFSLTLSSRIKSREVET